MKNVVILLGAGASYDFGAPLMKDFYRVASEIYSNTKDERVQEHFSTIFEFINKLQKAQAKANIDLHNIEQVYTALEMAKLLSLDHLKVKNMSWKRMDEAMKFFLTYNIENKTLLPPPPSTNAFQSRQNNLIALGMARKPDLTTVAAKIKKLLKDGWNVSIISFNYDLVAEAALLQEKIGTDYCIDDSIDKPPLTIPLLKLHGSINWHRESGSSQSKIQVIPYQGIYLQENLHLFDQVANGNLVTNLSKHITPFVIPPVWNKGSYQNSLSNVWKRAAEELSNASHVFCLGYSLPRTDGFFKQLYALGTIGVRPFLQFKVFDIEPAEQPEGVKSRYMELLGRGAENVFSYHSDGVEGLLKAIGEL